MQPDPLPRLERRIPPRRRAPGWLTWIEPITPVFLSVHGAVFMAESGETDPAKWALVVLTALAGTAGLAGWRTQQAVRVRAFGLLLVTWVLLILGGGVQAFFTLWFFMLAPVYALALGGRIAFVYPVVIGLAYPSLTLITEGVLPASVLWGRTGVIAGTGLIVAAISLERRLSAEDAMGAKDEFVASVSHELRTPLTAVVGLSAELRDRVSDLTATEVAEFAGMVHRQSIEVVNIVEDLLVAARAEASTVSIKVEAVDLRVEVDAVGREVAQLNRAVPFEIVVRGGAVTGSGDPVRVRQILRNVLTNAVRYGGSQIEVRLLGEPPLAVVEIADDGPGVPTEYREVIFEPYGRAHADSTQPSSIGLGLAVSRTLARLMDGDLSYGRVDGWSVFRFELPGAD